MGGGGGGCSGGGVGARLCWGAVWVRRVWMGGERVQVLGAVGEIVRSADPARAVYVQSPMHGVHTWLKVLV